MASISNPIQKKEKKGAGQFLSKKDYSQEIGASGTDINSGIISEDYNTDLQFPKSVDNYELMRKGDAQVAAAIDAVMLPVQTANWVVDLPEGGSEEHKAFIEKALWKDLETPFEHFIQEALSYLVFGFYYFEKVFKTDENGNIVWKKFAPRIPPAHLYWKTHDGKGSGEKQNEGITQQLKSFDYRNQEITDTNPQIPMSKLLLFVHRQEGDNFEGVSILRSAYKHWKMKELSYKVQMISNERYGVGVPVMTLPKTANDGDIDRAEMICKNLRSNEKSFIVMKEGWTFDIKSPNSDAKAGSIKDAVDHHNRMILMSVLAPFLDLGSGATGSYSLGETQMSFFINSLQRIAKYMTGIINAAIKELIDLNFGEQEFYPELRVTEIGSIDKTIVMNALAAGITSGAIVVDSKLRDWVRESLSLPEEDKEEIEFEKQESLKRQREIFEPNFEVEEKKEMSSKKKFAEPDVEISKREKLFTKTINFHEKDLLKKHEKVYIPMIRETEENIRGFLLKGYGRAKKENVAGVEMFARSGNMALYHELRIGIRERMERLEGKIERTAPSIHKESARQAFNVLYEMEQIKTFEDIVIEKGQINAFVAGHLSNVRGFVFNEGRQLTEKLLDNLTQQTSVNLVLGQTKEWRMNENITKLSIVTHPRALFRNVVFTNSAAQGANHYKPIIPSFRYEDIRPGGVTAGILFTILTAQQLNKRGTENNANTAGGMGTHHGDFSYYYPVDEENLDEEILIARKQRKQFLESQR